jgi:hypothetical protein
MNPDEAAIITTLATNRRGLTTTGIASHLRWFKETSVRQFRSVDEYRALRCLNRLIEQGHVVQHISGAGSRYKLANQLKQKT